MNTALNTSLISSLEGHKGQGRNSFEQKLESKDTSFATFVDDSLKHSGLKKQTSASQKSQTQKPKVEHKQSQKFAAKKTSEVDSENKATQKHSDIEAAAIENAIDTDSSEENIEALEIAPADTEMQVIATVIDSAKLDDTDRKEEIDAEPQPRENINNAREEETDQGSIPQAVATDARGEKVSSEIEETPLASEKEMEALNIRPHAEPREIDTKLQTTQGSAQNVRDEAGAFEKESTQLQSQNLEQELDPSLEALDAHEVKLSEIKQTDKEQQSAIQLSKAAEATSAAPKANITQEAKPDTEAPAAAVDSEQELKVSDAENSSDPDLMGREDKEAGAKIEIKNESQGKTSDTRSIFASSQIESSPSKPSASISSSELPEGTKQIFSQVQDHIKSVFTNNNVSKGESITTINLDPGNLGQISVQIVSSKDGDTQIKLIVSKEATHEIIRESWDVFVKENLEKVGGADNSSLSFSLERGDREDARNQQQDMWDFDLENTDSSRSQGPANKTSYDISGTAARGSSKLDLEKGHANIIL